MKHYTIRLRLDGAPAKAVAVEWTNQLDSDDGYSEPDWQPCLRLGDGRWKFSSREPFGATPPHERAPGVFGDLAIRYRLTAAGPWSEASATRKEIVVTEVTEEPQAGDPLPAAPVLVVAPVLAGLGKIGSEVTVTAGLWSGHAAPEISFQWRRAGVAIPGAVSRAYVPVPADDLTALDCVVTARNAAGETVAITAARTVTYPAPAVAGDLPDEIFDEDTGPQSVETDFAFYGENLVFTASSGVIDPATGVLTVSTDQPVSGQTVTVTAANSGGKVSAPVMITVEAAPPETGPAPFASGEFVIVRSDARPKGQTTTFSPIVHFPNLTSAERAAVQVQFRATPLGDSGAPWHPVRPLDGEAPYFYLPDAFNPATPTYNEALWINDSRLTGRLRFRHRFSSDQAWSAATQTINVPLPEEDTVTPPGDYRAFTHTLAEIQSVDQVEAIGYKMIRRKASGTGGTGCYRGFGVQAPVNIALSALAGDTHTLRSAAAKTWTFLDGARPGDAASMSIPGFPSGHTPQKRLLEILRYWGNDKQTMPSGHGGYCGQYEISFVSTVAIARKATEVWNQLTPVQKKRIQIAMKACMIACCFQDSDWHNRATSVDTSYPRWTTNWGNIKTVRGYWAGRNSNPNFSSPPKLIPRIVALFLAEDGIDAQAYMNNWTRASWLAECDSCNEGSGNGVQDARETFAQTWDAAWHMSWYGSGDSTYGGYQLNDPAPNEAQIKRAISGGASGVWKSEGFTIEQASEAALAEINRFFSKRIQPGPQVMGGTPLVGAETGPGWTTKHGIKSEELTNGILVACIGKRISATNNATDKSAWAGLPNAGQMHRAFELETNDAGGPTKAPGRGPKLRASMSYVRQGTAALFMGLAALGAYGAIGRTSELAAIKTKLNAGITDLKYIDQHGWRSFAHGGRGEPTGGSRTNNEDWGPGNTGDFNLVSEFALAGAFLRHLNTL